MIMSKVLGTRVNAELFIAIFGGSTCSPVDYKSFSVRKIYPPSLEFTFDFPTFLWLKDEISLTGKDQFHISKVALNFFQISFIG